MALFCFPGVLGGPTQGIWITPEELSGLPASGPAWDDLLEAANLFLGSPDLSDQDQNHNVYVLAKALVYARTGNERFRSEVIRHVMNAMGTEDGGRTLSLGRELAAYVIAADLVQLPDAEDQRFRTWLRSVITENLSGRTLRSTHEDRPNNWGTHAGASRLAAAVYLNDSAEIEAAAEVFRGWLGERQVYAGFKYGDLSWQANPSLPVGINPAGATKQGRNIDGVLPDDQRRGGSFTWPPPRVNYVYEALQGALVQAVILHRLGYPAFEWSDRALLRAYRWLYEVASFRATGDDTWQMPLVDYYYGTRYWDGDPTRFGKNMGWTHWTHSGLEIVPEPPTNLRVVPFPEP